MLLMPLSAWAQTTYKGGDYSSTNNSWGDWTVTGTNVEFSSSGSSLSCRISAGQTSTIQLSLTKTQNTSEKLCALTFSPSSSKVSLVSAKIVDSNDETITEFTTQIQSNGSFRHFTATTPIEWGAGDKLVLTCQYVNETNTVATPSISGATVTTGTPYDLVVDGIIVTTANKDCVTGGTTDWNGNSEVSIVSFDPTGNKLNLCKADDLTGPIQLGSSMNSLTIDINGNCKITTTDAAAISSENAANITFTSSSSGSLNLKRTEGTGLVGSNITVSYGAGVAADIVAPTSATTLADATEADISLTAYDLIISGEQVTSANMNAICENQGANSSISFDGEHTLTFNNVPNVGFDSSNYPGFIQTSMNLTINLVGISEFDCGNSTFIASGDNNTHTVTFTTDADDPGMLSLTVGDQFVGFTKAFENGLSWKPSYYYKTNAPAAWVAIPYTEYGITVGGVAVTSANASNIRGEGFDAYKVSYSPSTKTLSLENAYFSGGVSTNDDLTISAIGSNTIYGDVTSSKNGGATLTIRKGETDEGVTLNLSPSSSDPTGFSSVVYDNMYLSDENDRDVMFSPTRQRFEKNEWQITETVSFTSEVTYDLWIGGTMVTEENKNNVLGTVDAAPTVTFNPQGNILTLNNMSLSSTSIYNSGIISRLSALTIVVNGNNTITNNDSCTAIRADAPMAQTLTIQRGSADNCSLRFSSYRPIRNFKTLTVTDLYWNDTFTYGYDETFSSYRLMKGDNEEASVNEETGFVPTLGDPTVYALYIGDTQVTSLNADDVLGDGKVSFEVNAQTATPTYTLTLNGAVLTVPVKVGLANLTFDIRGNNTITTNTTCIQNTASTGVPSLTFKSNADVVGSLIMTNTGGDAISQIGQGNISISKELAVFLTVYGYDDYTSNLYYITDGSTTVAKIVPSYGVTVNDIQVYEGNAADVLGDGKVSFNEKTATLTLNNADGISTISTSLSELNIDLVGNNSLYRSSNGSIFESASGEAVTINLKSTDGAGLLTIETPTNYGATIIGENVTLTPVAPVFESYNNVDNNKGKLQYAVNSGITITAASGSYPINSSNRTNVLNDSEGHETVQFDGRNTLILNGAELTSINIANQHVLQKLVIYLKGTNTINNNDNNGIIYGGEGESKLPLTYATGDGSTEDSQPGTLTCTYHVEDAEHPEVMDIYDKFDVSYDNNLGESQNTTNHTINIAVVMSPIVTEGHHEVERQGLGQDIESKNTTQLTEGVIVNKLLYTLPGDKDGYIVDEDYVQVNGKVVALNTPMDDGEVNDILEYIKNGLIQPGTKLGAPNTFAERFHGMSFLLPAGYGEISLDVNTNVNTNEAGILHVKVGSNEPVAITGTTGFETIKIPYALTEESYVFIYRYAPSTPLSRGDDGHRAPGRKETTTTGIRGLSVNANSVESSPEPPVSPKLLDKSLLKQDRDHIYIETEDAVDVEGIESDAFANLTGDITYIDLSNTAIKDILVDRKQVGSPFKGLSEKTFIYLPAGNTIAPSAPGHENKNMVIGSVCDKMEMDDSAPFEVAKDFIALDAKQTRTYTIGQNATIYLPFAINSETASALGTFYELTGIADGKVTFKSVEETEETKANTPYLFKPKTTTLSAKMAEVKTLTSAPYTGDARFIGRYSQKSILSTTTIQCYCFNATDGKFVHVVDQPMTVDPFRAYIEVSGMSLGRSLEINTGDDDVTAIKNIKVGTEENVYYDLQGRRVLYPKKGIYIVNGKKVILK